LTAFYHSQAIHTPEALRIPVSYECVKKTIRYCEIKTRKEKRQSAVSKNEMMHSIGDDTKQPFICFAPGIC
jgi:hypothetical protein